MNNVKKIFILFTGIILNSSLLGISETAKPNVLFIAIDDLRPELGCYGAPQVKSPHIDKLAQQSLLFDRAYCQYATCSPSRTSLLTGMRPDNTKVLNLKTHFRDTIPDVVTLPEHFKDNGYITQAFGKIYHGDLNDKQSWSIPWQQIPGKRLSKEKLSWRNIPNDKEHTLSDYQIYEGAAKALRGYKKKKQPFFLAVGFRKPHLSFDAPQRFYDMYPLEDVPLATNLFRPKNSPDFDTTDDSGEVRTYHDIPPKSAGPIGEKKARELIRGYFACTSWIDELTGKLLAELDKLDLRKNTIIVVWSDHGWHLGEHQQWGKHTNFEIATRVPMMISHPGQTTRGQKTKKIVELLDIFPTLCDLANLNLPDHLEGESLVPILKNPDCEWDKVAYSQWPRPYLGYTMKTKRYRYTEWVPRNKPGGKIVAQELYDHDNDPDENVNLAGMPAHKELLKKLSKRLRSDLNH